ncbi:hypothetical protein [Streptomyces lunaelactis]|uniref:hypothetical protein n=1 Tax=Streptomyces lunaelactis TaxID=1535768 RepID=UPI001584C466|nr:hypothetical protein [Streptomyces lunaelactis]NUK15701.1 hypothetical protein [Streptomyces lunaelactis]
MTDEAEWQSVERLLSDTDEVAQREGVCHLRGLGRRLSLRRRASEVLADYVARPEAHPDVRAEARTVVREWVPWRVRRARRRLVVGESLHLVLAVTQGAAIPTALGIGFEPATGVRVAAALTAGLVIALMVVCSWVTGGAMADEPPAWRQRRRIELFSATTVIMMWTAMAAALDWAVPAVGSVIGTLFCAAALLWARLEPTTQWWRQRSS